MTHEEFLRRLITGFAGEPSVPTPSYTGSSEEDALVRWLSYHVANALLEQGTFELTEGGRMLLVQVDRVWSRWATDDVEDVDLTIFGRRGARPYSIGLKARASRNGDGYFLRITDWSTRRALDLNGVRRGEAPGPVRILDTGQPLLWTIPGSLGQESSGAAETGSDELPLPSSECCRRSLETIARITESGGALAEMLAAAPYIVALGRTPRPAILGLLWKLGSGGANYGRMRSTTRRVTDVIVRERVRTVIQLEIISHASGPEGRYWERMLEVFN